MTIMQGDSCKIPFVIYTDDILVTDQLVEKVEFTIGTIAKEYPGDAEYADGEFKVPLTQEDTLSVQGKQPVQVRVKLSSGDVYGVKLDPIEFEDSMSRVVL